MRDHQTDPVDPDAVGRQAQLRAAAKVLRTWVYDQRATWPERPDDGMNAEPDEFIELERFANPVPSPPAEWLPVVTPIEVEPERQPPPVAAVETVKPVAVRFSIENVEEPRDWAALLRRVGSVAAGVAVVAGLAFAGWKALTYVLNRPPAVPQTGTAVLESAPPGSDLFIDGKLVGKTPIVTKLAAGSHNIEFRRRNSSRKLTISVPADGYVKEQLDWTAKRKGSLEVLSEPDGASVTVDGVPRGVTPLTIDDLTIGSHTVVLDSASGSITRSVTVSADKVAQVTEAIYSGWLHVSTPIELEISEGGRPVRLDERNQALLRPGTHTLQVQNVVFGYQERKTVEVKPGAITSIAIEPPPSLLTVTASLPGEVLVDGQRIGELPLEDRAIALGTRLIVVRSITGAERHFTVTATVKPISLVVDFARP